MELKYRADIDGLRAIAVLAVLFFHTDIPGFSGGYVGVDVFFVISGFLITSIILKDIRQNRFSIARFYERRIRRIFPALFPVIAFVLLAGSYLFEADAFKNLGQSITATTLFFSNILFSLEKGYFAAPSLEKPLLHTWSLAVEEQFYIFFPLLLMLISKYLKGLYFPWLITIFSISLAASIYGVTNTPTETFYLVHTRAWELMTGSLLAIGVLPKASGIWQKNFLAFTGLIMIISSIVLYTEATPFPGKAALLPVLGSALVIYSGLDGGTFTMQKILSVRPLVFIGLISYSLYLWHWPIVVFWKYLLLRQFNIYDSATIIFLSIIFAFLSWKFIEQPFRGKMPLIPERKKLFALSGAIMAITIITGQLIYITDGIKIRAIYLYPDIAKSLDKAKASAEKLVPKNKFLKDQRVHEKRKPIIVGQPAIAPSFVLVGDSHALTMIPAMEYLANKSKLSGIILGNAGTPLLSGVSVYNPALKKVFKDAEYNNKVMSFIQNNKNIKTVILVSRWGLYIHGFFTDKNERDTREENYGKLYDITGKYPDEPVDVILDIGLQRTINALLSMDRNVVLVSDVPEVGYDVPKAYYISSRFPELLDFTTIRPTLADYNRRQKEANAILESLARRPGVTLIRPDKLMFDEHGTGRIMENGELLYLDDDHLSIAGALYITPAFDRLFATMALKAKARHAKTETSASISETE